MTSFSYDLERIGLDSPFFVLGNPRSGTSMFRLMLNSHPGIVVPPECGFLEWLSEEYSGKSLGPALYERFARDVYCSKKFSTWGMGFEELLGFIETASPKNYRELCLSIYLCYAMKKDKSPIMVGDKNNYYIEKVQVVDSLFPESKKIFIIRDGRDVACSYRALNKKNARSIYYPKLSYSIKEIAEEWKTNAKTAHAYQARGALVIRYEDLLLDAEEKLREVCGYLSMPYDEVMLRFHENNDEPEGFLEWKGKTKQAVQSDNKGKYRDILSDAQIREFEDVASEMLVTYGYEVANGN